jgi:hypothetical protein
MIGALTVGLAFMYLLWFGTWSEIQSLKRRLDETERKLDETRVGTIGMINLQKVQAEQTFVRKDALN